MAGPPRPRPVAEADARRRPRTARSPGSRSTCSPTWAPTSALGRRRRAGPRRVDVQRDLQVPRLPVQLHQPCSPTRPGPTPTAAPAGPEATYAIERLMDELAVEVGVDPLEIREKNWIKHEEFPFTTVCRAGVRLRQLRGGDGEGQGDVRLRRAARRAAAAPRRRRPGPARHRHLDVHRDVRSRAVAGCSARSTTAPAAGSTRRSGCCAHRQGRGRHRRQRPRPGPRDGVQPDRRRPARRAVRGRRGAARRHPDLARRASTPTARGRSSSAARRWCRRPTR